MPVALWDVTFTLRVRGEAGNREGNEQGGRGGRDVQKQENWAEHLTRSAPSHASPLQAQSAFLLQAQESWPTPPGAKSPGEERLL